MGKGDMKSKRGKIFRGSYGVRRPRKKSHISKNTLTKNPQENAPDLQEQMTDIKVGKEKETTKGSGKSSKTKGKTQSGGKKSDESAGA